MTTNKIYEITNWNQHFEKAQTRSKPVAKHSWVAMPNKHEGLGFKKIMRDDRGLEIFAVWILLVQIASKAPIRGRLADEDGEAYTFDDLALYACCKTEAFEYAIPFLVDLKWVTQHSDTAVLPQCDHAITAVGTTLHNTTEQDTTEQNKTEQNITAALAIPRSHDSNNNYIDQREARMVEQKDEVGIVLASIPKNRLDNLLKTRAAIVSALNRCNGDRIQAAILLGERMKLYFESSAGQSTIHKSPHCFLDEDCHLADPSCWESRAKPKPTSGWDSVPETKGTK